MENEPWLSFYTQVKRCSRELESDWTTWSLAKNPTTSLEDTGEQGLGTSYVSDSVLLGFYLPGRGLGCIYLP